MDYVEFLINHGSPAGTGTALFAIASALMVGGAAAMAAIAIAPPIQRWLAPPPPEVGFEDYIPIETIEDDGVTLKCRHGWLARAWAIAGKDHTSLSNAERNRLYRAREAMLNALAREAGNLEARFLTVRERESDESAHVERRLHGTETVNEIVSRWSAAAGENVYVNRHYMMVYARDTKDGRNALEHAGSMITETMEAYSARLLRAPQSPRDGHAEGPGRAVRDLDRTRVTPEALPAGRGPAERAPRLRRDGRPPRRAAVVSRRTRHAPRRGARRAGPARRVQRGACARDHARPMRALDLPHATPARPRQGDHHAGAPDRGGGTVLHRRRRGPADPDARSQRDHPGHPQVGDPGRGLDLQPHHRGLRRDRGSTRAERGTGPARAHARRGNRGARGIRGRGGVVVDAAVVSRDRAALALPHVPGGNAVHPANHHRRDRAPRLGRP